MASRKNILNRLKAGRFQSDMSAEPTAQNEPVEVKSQQYLSDHFEQALAAANAEYRFCNQQNQTETIINWLEELKLTQCWVSEDSVLGQAIRQQQPQNIQWVNPADPMGVDRSQVFNEIEIGITMAHSAIAETGTLVVIPDANEPRTMSLVPPVHLVVLNKNNLCWQFEDWVLDNPDVHKNTNVVLITGPSKTADIQQTLAFGAHGPKRLLVLIVE